MRKKIITGILLSLFLTGCSNTTASIQKNEDCESTLQDVIIIENDTGETVSESMDNEEPEKSANEIATEIVNYFTTENKPKGNYVIFDNENVEDDNKIEFILRYQASDAEVDEIISAGKFPEPNVYVMTITYYKDEKKFVDEFDRIIPL